MIVYLPNYRIFPGARVTSRSDFKAISDAMSSRFQMRFQCHRNHFCEFNLISKRFQYDFNVIAKRFHMRFYCAIKTISMRSHSNFKMISLRFQMWFQYEFNVISMRFQYEFHLISKRFQSDVNAIMGRLRKDFRGDCVPTWLLHFSRRQGHVQVRF